MKNTFLTAKDIFVSWNHHDRELKDKVVQTIEKGLLGDVAYQINSTLWVWDSDQNCTGDIDSSCLHSIDLCSVFVVLITENALKSDWVAKEINRALDTRGSSFIVPVHISGIIPTDIDNPFRRAVGSSGIDKADGRFDGSDASVLIEKVIAVFNESCYWDYLENGLHDILTIDNEINNTEATNASVGSIYIERTLRKYNDPDDAEIGERELVALTAPVLVIGEGGSGKSWQIRNIIHNVRETRADSAPLIFSVPLKEMRDYKGSFVEYLFSLFIVPSRSFGYTLENFKALLKSKNHHDSLFIFFDAIDEILRNDAIKDISKKLSGFFAKYPESIGNTFFTSRNPDYAFVCNALNIESERIKAFSLVKFDAEKRKSAVDKLFLQLRFEGDKDFFFAALDSISEEITSNPYLLTQLVIIYKNDGSVPDALSEIYEKSVRYYLKRGPDSERYPELPEILSRCAYDKFVCEAVKNERFDFEKTLNSMYDNETRAKEVLSYLHNRSIVINNNFSATLVFELLTSVRLFHLLVIGKTISDDFGADTKAYSINTDLAAKIAENAAGNNNWGNVLKIFLSKVDNELDEQAIRSLYKSFVGSSDNFMLFFETASSILKKRRAFELTVLSGILLERTLKKEFGYYDELFFYIPKFGLYHHLAEAVLSVDDHSLTAYYLLRDICFIYGNKDKLTEVDHIGVYARKLSETFAALRGDTYRYKLCELFYGEDIIAPKKLAKKYRPLYPREFCMIHAANRAAANADKALKKQRDLEEAALDSPTAFIDSDQLYAATDFDCPCFTGLCFLPYDAERINSCVTLQRAEMLSGIILLPSEDTKIEQMKFPKTNLLYYSVPYNATALCDYCYNFCRDITYMFIPASTESITTKSFISVKRLWLYYEYSSRRTTITRFLPEQTELYKLTADSVELIEGMAFMGCRNITFPSLPDSVTEIGKVAFIGCTSLALTSLPDGVTVIGEGAFSGCTSLVLTSLPDGVTVIEEHAFESCTSLALASLPDGVTVIERFAFYHCTNLALTSLPDGVTVIREHAFATCINLALTSLPDRVAMIEEGAFESCISLALTSLPNGVTVIGRWAFEGCTSLALASLPEGLSYVDESVFSGCSDRIRKLVYEHIERLKSKNATIITHNGCTVHDNEYLDKTYLTDIYFINGLSRIGLLALKGCTSLALTSLPDGVTKIGAYAFYGCTSLALTSLPAGVTVIRKGAFSGCTSLALTSLPDGVTKIEDFAFSGCTSLALTSLPDGVTKTEGFSFSGCTSLALASLPNGVTVIRERAFAACINLALTSLPDGVTEIGWSAFEGCISLALTSLPDGVTEIGWSAFSGCTSLALTSLPDGLTEIHRSTFSGCTGLTLTELPRKLVIIGESAFESCTGITEMNIPESVQEIGDRAFFGCSLRRVRIRSEFQLDVQRIFGDTSIVFDFY